MYKKKKTFKLLLKRENVDDENNCYTRVCIISGKYLKKKKNDNLKHTH